LIIVYCVVVKIGVELAGEAERFSTESVLEMELARLYDRNARVCMPTLHARDGYQKTSIDYPTTDIKQVQSRLEEHSTYKRFNDEHDDAVELLL